MDLISSKSITDPSSGDQTDGFPATVKINETYPKDSLPEATADISVTDDGGAVLSLCKGIPTDRGCVQWTPEDNKSTQWPDDPNVQRMFPFLVLF